MSRDSVTFVVSWLLRLAMSMNFSKLVNNHKKLIMTKNVGSTDKMIRIVLALVLGYLYYSGVLTGTAGIIAIVVGAIALLTAVINYCPLYSVIHMSTNKK